MVERYEYNTWNTGRNSGYGQFNQFTGCCIEITDTVTGETRVCEDFTYLDDDSQATLEYLFKTNFEQDLSEYQ